MTVTVTVISELALNWNLHYDSDSDFVDAVLAAGAFLNDSDHDFEDSVVVIVKQQRLHGVALVVVEMEQ